MAFAQSDNPLEGTFPGAMFFDRFDEVTTARRFEAAMPAEKRAEQHLVNSDTENQKL